MDVQAINERIARLIRTRDACQCQSEAGRTLRQLANRMIEHFLELKNEIQRANDEGFFGDE